MRKNGKELDEFKSARFSIGYQQPVADTASFWQKKFR